MNQLTSIEKWRQIIDFSDYEVSDGGRVRRLTAAQRIRTGRFLRQQRHPKGYFHVGLSRGAAHTTVRQLVHRLVATAFLEGPDVGEQVNHIDGDKANNRASNLEWVTAGENIRHAIGLGLRPVGVVRRR